MIVIGTLFWKRHTRLNFEPAKSRKLAIELRFSSAAIRGQLRIVQAPLGCEPPDIPPHRAGAEIAPGSCQGPVHLPDTVVEPVHPKRARSRLRQSA